MPTYSTFGALQMDGVTYPPGTSIVLPAGAVRDKLLTSGAIYRPDLPPFVYRDRGDSKLVPAESGGLNRVIYGQVRNSDYIKLMSRLGFPLTDVGRRDAVQRWSGLLNCTDFLVEWLDPPLPPLNPACGCRLGSGVGSGCAALTSPGGMHARSSRFLDPAEMPRRIHDFSAANRLPWAGFLLQVRQMVWGLKPCGVRPQTMWRLTAPIRRNFGHESDTEGLEGQRG